jgi:hypothetical protein
MAPRTIGPALLEEPPADDLRVNRVVCFEVPPLIVQATARIGQHIGAVLVVTKRFDGHFFLGESIG